MARNLEPVFLHAESVDWAIKHIQRFGDTDIFPVPFEFHAYQVVWEKVQQHLRGIDVANAEVIGSWKMMIPKHREGFRGATQLSPIDALLYTALVYESASTIDKGRAGVGTKIACAYRLDLQGDGRFFQKDTGWRDFHFRSKELIAEEGCAFVLCADIADFYNQISHHRVQGAIASSGVQENRSQVIERFLGNINALHHSRGIPVGPSVSILLAEACLSDVDSFLAESGYKHTRYVDDFRIFCRTHEEALCALYALSEYLYTAHRLSLQAGKTRILESWQFVLEELEDPQTQETEAKEARLQELLEEVEENGDYGIWQNEEVEIDEAKLAIEVVVELFNQVLAARALQLGLSRYILRRAATMRCRAILTPLVRNIERFVPVLRDAVLYVLKVAHPSNYKMIGEALRYLVCDSEFRSFPYVQYWALTAFQEIPGFAPAGEVMRIANESNSAIRDRMLALSARAHRQVAWVRSKKETWSNVSPAAQRANIWAASILPRDERNHWLQPIRNNPDISISAVADATFIINREAP